MRINVLEAPEGASFTEGQGYPVYGELGSSFVFDDDSESFFISELNWKEDETDEPVYLY